MSVSLGRSIAVNNLNCETINGQPVGSFGGGGGITLDNTSPPTSTSTTTAPTTRVATNMATAINTLGTNLASTITTANGALQKSSLLTVAAGNAPQSTSTTTTLDANSIKNIHDKLNSAISAATPAAASSTTAGIVKITDTVGANYVSDTAPSISAIKDYVPSAVGAASSHGTSAVNINIGSSGTTNQINVNSARIDLGSAASTTQLYINGTQYSSAAANTATSTQFGTTATTDIIVGSLNRNTDIRGNMMAIYPAASQDLSFGQPNGNSVIQFMAGQAAINFNNNAISNFGRSTSSFQILGSDVTVSPTNALTLSSPSAANSVARLNLKSNDTASAAGSDVSIVAMQNSSGNDVFQVRTQQVSGTNIASGIVQDCANVFFNVRVPNALYATATASWSAGSGTTVTLTLSGFANVPPSSLTISSGDYVSGLPFSVNALTINASPVPTTTSITVTIPSQSYSSGSAAVQLVSALPTTYPAIQLNGSGAIPSIVLNHPVSGNGFAEGLKTPASFGVNSTSSVVVGTLTQNTTLNGNNLSLFPALGSTLQLGQSGVASTILFASGQSAINFSNNPISGFGSPTAALFLNSSITSFNTTQPISATASHLARIRGIIQTAIISCTSETGTATTSTAPAASFRVPFEWTVLGARASYTNDTDGTPPTSAIVIDIRQNATPMSVNTQGTSIFDTAKLNIDVNRYSTVGSTAVANNGRLLGGASNVVVNDDNVVSIFVTSTSTGASGVKVTIYYTL